MKLPLVFLAAATLLLQSGCVAGRRTLSLSVPTGSVLAATKGKAHVVSVTDNRVFENKPSSPSTPSIDGDVSSISAAQKDRMIGRQRNGFGHAMGDIGLEENDSVTKRVRLLVEEGLRRDGYQVTSDSEGAMPVTVSVDKFWVWMTPGMWALTFEARIMASITLTTAAGSSTFVVLGEGTNHGQSAKDGNWMEAYQPAFEAFLANFKREIDKIEAPTSH
jgi:uncharacterized lipoprotein YajG